MKKLILLILMSFVMVSCLDSIECGDGRTEGFEQCDDGNTINGDGCSASCTTEGGENPDAVCGNGKKEGSEQCDDGNKIPGDGCSATCMNEVDPSTCTDLKKNIDEPTTLDGCYNVKSSIYINSDLKIEPGSKFIMGNGKWIIVASSGSINAVGTKAKPILFTGEEKTKGYWDSIDIRSNTTKNELAHIAMEYGKTPLVVGGRLKFSDSLLQENKESGFYFKSGAVIDKFERITSTKNGDYAGYIRGADILNALDSESKFTGNRLDFIYLNANVENEQTWNELTVPIFVDGSMYVNSDLTINPGVRIVFGSDKWMIVSDNGSINAVGTEAKPILFTGEEKTKGYWDSIDIRSNTTKNELAHVIMEYGKTPLVVGGRLKFSNSLLQENKESGFYFKGGAVIDKFEKITSTKNNDYAGYIRGADVVNMIDSESKLTGNGKDFVYLNANVETEQTWNALTVPILIDGSMYVNAGLTIKPGARIVFGSGKWMIISNDGYFNAVGTSDNYITFEGKDKTKSYWDSIEIRSNSNSNQVEYCKFEDATIGLKINGGSRSSVKNSKFSNSETGIYIADSDDTNTNLTGNDETKDGNTFDSNDTNINDRRLD